MDNCAYLKHILCVIPTLIDAIISLFRKSLAQHRDQRGDLPDRVATLERGVRAEGVAEFAHEGAAQPERVLRRGLYLV